MSRLLPYIQRRLSMTELDRRQLLVRAGTATSAAMALGALGAPGALADDDDDAPKSEVLERLIDAIEDHIEHLKSLDLAEDIAREIKQFIDEVLHPGFEDLLHEFAETRKRHRHLRRLFEVLDDWFEEGSV
jgi:hypothetical protein